jgi:hypothetical protein
MKKSTLLLYILNCIFYNIFTKNYHFLYKGYTFMLENLMTLKEKTIEYILKIIKKKCVFKDTLICTLNISEFYYH